MRRVRLTEFRKQFAGEDPARGNAFDAFFLNPAVERAYREAMGTFTEEGSVTAK